MSYSNLLSHSDKAIEIYNLAKLGIDLNTADKFGYRSQVDTIKYLLQPEFNYIPKPLAIKAALKVKDPIYFKAIKLGVPFEHIFNFKHDWQLTALEYIKENFYSQITPEIAIEAVLLLSNPIEALALVNHIPIDEVDNFKNEFQVAAYKKLTSKTLSNQRINDLINRSLKINDKIKLDALTRDIPDHVACQFTNDYQADAYQLLSENENLSSEFIAFLSLKFINPNALLALDAGAPDVAALLFTQYWQVYLLNFLVQKGNTNIVTDEIIEQVLSITDAYELEIYKQACKLGINYKDAFQFKDHHILAFNLLTMKNNTMRQEEKIKIALIFNNEVEVEATLAGVPEERIPEFKTMTQIYALFTFQELGLTQTYAIDTALLFANFTQYQALVYGAPLEAALKFETDCQVDAFIKLQKLSNEEWFGPSVEQNIEAALNFTSSDKCSLLEQCHRTYHILVVAAAQDLLGEIF